MNNGLIGLTHPIFPMPWNFCGKMGDIKLTFTKKFRNPCINDTKGRVYGDLKLHANPALRTTYIVALMEWQTKGWLYFFSNRYFWDCLTSVIMDISQKLASKKS